MRIKKRIATFLVFLMALSGLSGIATPVSAASDYVNVTRQVNPAEITTEGEATVELSIQGTPPVSVVRPNDVILVIDKSGSMSGDKMTAARNSAKGFIDLMDMSVHRVGIVDFSSKSNISTFPLTTDVNAAKTYIDTIKDNGGTATGDAIDSAVAELIREPREGAQPVIVLLTDGDAQEPKGDPFQFALDRATAAKNAGIVFYTIALLNVNDNPDTSGPNNLLKKMATTFNHHHFVLGSVGLSEIYAAIVKEIGVASAYDVRVKDYVSDQFEIVPDSYQHNIPVPVVSGNELTWNFQELKMNTLKFTYKIRPKNQTDVGTFNVATQTANVSYKDYAGAERSKLIPNKTIKVKYPAPIITSIVEPSGHPVGGNEIVINGDKFKDGARVFFNNIESKAVTFVDGQTLKVLVPAGNQGAVTVKVSNPDGQSGTGSYQYKTDPVVTSYTPNEGPLEGNTVVTFNGSYFLPGMTVKFGDQAANITTLRTNYLIVNSPAVEQVGSVDIILLNPDGTSLTIPLGFTYKEAVKPKLMITSIAPASGVPAGGESVFINGKLIDPLVKVYFGPNEAQVQSIQSTDRIQVLAPAGVAGIVDVRLVNPDGQEATLPNAYTYAMPEYAAPVAQSINPNSGEMTGGQIAYIIGSGFRTDVKVFVNNVMADVSNITALRLMVVIPPSTITGTFDVQVVNSDGKSSTLPASYTYNEPPIAPEPILDTITPDNGLITGNSPVVLNGQNFIKGAVVYFDTVEIPTTFVSSKQLKIATPLWNQPATVQIKVKNPDNKETIELVTYTYTEPLPEPVSITSINPAKGLTTGGEIIYLNGTNFKRGIQVFFGDVEAAVNAYNSTYRVSVIAPPSISTGQVDVRVINPDKGTFTLSGAYTYTLTQPTITSLSPSAGPIAGGTNLYINGTNFEQNMTVTINGVVTPIDIFTSTVRVKVTTPPSVVAGGVPIVVTLSNGESATTTFTYEEVKLGPEPKITSLNVTSGIAAGGNTLYINGTNFVRGAKVFFNGVESTKVTFTSALRVTAVVPAGTGITQVTVVNPDGQVSNIIEYTYK